MKAPELTQIAIEWLKRTCEQPIIVTEMSVADWGGAMLDIAAITPSEIVGVEIKGEGDSPTRLELQGLRYGQVARRMWLLVTPEGSLASRCEKKRPRGWGLLDVSENSIQPAIRYKNHDGTHVEYSEPKPSQSLNPWAMCGTLWRDELCEIARLHSLTVKGRALVGPLTDAICEQMPVPALHDAMIGQLRRRQWRRPVIDCRSDAQRRADHAIAPAQDQVLLL